MRPCLEGFEELLAAASPGAEWRSTYICALEDTHQKYAVFLSRTIPVNAEPH